MVAITHGIHCTHCTGTGFDRLDFTYDGEGHRTKIVETPMAGTPITTRDLRYQADAVVEESVNGLIVRSVIVDDAGAPTKLVVTNAGSANGTYLPTWSGHGDLLALWQVQADGTLTLAASVTYDTWGKPSITSANGIPDLGFSRLYVGRSDVWWDNTDGAGLLYMHARTYSPTLGRFLQPDPVAAEGNLYAYAGNSPVTKADPSGRFWYKVGARDHTVAQLAARFHVSVASMYRFNRPYITRSRPYLHPGMCLWIWQPEKINGTRSPSFDTGSCSGWTTYAVDPRHRPRAIPRAIGGTKVNAAYCTLGYLSLALGTSATGGIELALLTGVARGSVGGPAGAIGGGILTAGLFVVDYYLEQGRSQACGR